jgi:GTP:adenosylcobinamide-phosphate guanylyltransferase
VVERRNTLQVRILLQVQSKSAKAVRCAKISINMESNIIEICQADMLQAINRAEIDIQISTAKQYPRDLQQVLNKIATYATMDKETAEDCFYVLRREGANGQSSVIEGLSVRMAEIIASSWGNLRVQSRIIGNDGKMITAQAICHDLETNLAVSKEVKRRITNKYGKTYSEDMQVVTGNAASSIAFRNAVLAVIPKAVTKRIINDVKKVALGQSIDLETTRQRMIDYYVKIGVSQQQIFEYLEIKSLAEIDKEKVFELRALANAIKEGTTSVAETFKKNTADAEKLATEARNKSEAAKNKVAAATAAATGTTSPANIDPETGEIKEEK